MDRQWLCPPVRHLMPQSAVILLPAVVLAIRVRAMSLPVPHRTDVFCFLKVQGFRRSELTFQVTCVFFGGVFLDSIN